MVVCILSRTSSSLELGMCRVPTIMKQWFDKNKDSLKKSGVTLVTFTRFYDGCQLYLKNIQHKTHLCQTSRDLICPLCELVIPYSDPILHIFL